MKQVNLYEAKTNLSALVDEAAGGEAVIIAKNGKAKAMLVPVEAIGDVGRRKRKDPEFGFWNHYGWTLPENFDAPDPEIDAMFNDGPVFPDDGA